MESWLIEHLWKILGAIAVGYAYLLKKVWQSDNNAKMLKEMKDDNDRQHREMGEKMDDVRERLSRIEGKMEQGD